jgi:hypothetical protein
MTQHLSKGIFLLYHPGHYAGGNKYVLDIVLVKQNNRNIFRKICHFDLVS